MQPIPRPFVCVEFISEVGLVMSPLPTDQKTASGRQKWTQGFDSCLTIAWSYGVFDSKFGIYVKSYVYRGVFGIFINFYGELGSKSCLWPKSCFCYSRTAASVPDQTDPGFWSAIVESTSDWSESCFFWWYVRHSLPYKREYSFFLTIFEMIPYGGC